MANVTTTTAAVDIAQIWTKEIEKPFYKNLAFAKLVKQRGDLVQGGGGTINIPFLSTYNARAKASGTAVTFDAATETSITLSINKQYYLAVLIEDIAKVQANYNLQEIYRGAQAEAVARQIDTDLASLYGSAGTTTAAGAALTDASVITTVVALDTNNVPRSERYGVIGAGAHGDLLSVNKYTTYDSTGKTGTAVGSGSTNDSSLIANVYGFDLQLSNNVVFATTGQEMFFHKSAISLALQLKPTYKMEDSVDFIGMKTVLHTIYGVAVERATALAVITRNTAI
jgi:hypothetical protein